MVILILMGILIGALLGLRFQVLMLVPVLCGAFAMVVLGGLARGEGVLQLGLELALIAIALQVGYFVGSVVGLPGAAPIDHRKVSRPTPAGIPGSV
jgi:hypothetical protein